MSSTHIWDLSIWFAKDVRVVMMNMTGVLASRLQDGDALVGFERSQKLII